MASSRRSVFPNGWLDKKHRWASKSPTLAATEGALKHSTKYIFEGYCSRLGLPPHAQLWKSLEQVSHGRIEHDSRGTDRKGKGTPSSLETFFT